MWICCVNIMNEGNSSRIVVLYRAQHAQRSETVPVSKVSSDLVAFRLLTVITGDFNILNFNHRYSFSSYNLSGLEKLAYYHSRSQPQRTRGIDLVFSGNYSLIQSIKVSCSVYSYKWLLEYFFRHCIFANAKHPPQSVENYIQDVIPSRLTNIYLNFAGWTWLNPKSSGSSWGDR